MDFCSFQISSLIGLAVVSIGIKGASVVPIKSSSRTASVGATSSFWSRSSSESLLILNPFLPHYLDENQ